MSQQAIGATFGVLAVAIKLRTNEDNLDDRNRHATHTYN
jgi:hypothetical protein